MPMCKGPHYHFNVRLPSGKTILLSEIDYNPVKPFIFNGFTESTIGHLYIKVADSIGVSINLYDGLFESTALPFNLYWNGKLLSNMNMELRHVNINGKQLPLCLATYSEPPIMLEFCL